MRWFAVAPGVDAADRVSPPPLRRKRRRGFNLGSEPCNHEILRLSSAADRPVQALDRCGVSMWSRGVSRARAKRGCGDVGGNFHGTRRATCAASMLPGRSHRIANHRIAVRTPKQAPVYLSPLQRHVLRAVQSRHPEHEIAQRLQVTARELDEQLLLLRELGLIDFTTSDAEDRPTLPEVPSHPASGVRGRSVLVTGAHRVVQRATTGR